MCHRRGDWSRTSSNVSEPEDESDTDREPWVARARSRLAAFVPTDTDEAEDPEAPPVRPSVDSDATGIESGDEPEDREDEREEDPIPADD